MPGRLVKYYFSRLNLIATYKDKKEYLKLGLNTEKFIENYGYLWGFCDIGEAKTKYGDFLYGFLVKYKSEKEEEIILPESHLLSEERAKNRVEAKARFILHVKSGLITYHPVGGQIEKDIFCDRFVDIFQAAYENMFVNVEIQTIEEQYKIFEAIKNFKYISKVDIYLHPSNPSNAERWKRIDERLKKLEVTGYRENYENKQKEKSLKIIEDDDITSKITMADDGYGEAAITGLYGDDVKTISTKDNPVNDQAPGDEATAEEVLEILDPTIGKIFDRYIK